MADAQANKSVYKRMSAKLGNPSTGTGAIDPAGNVPGGTYSRKKADTSNGKSLYKRKSSGATAANNVNDGYQTQSTFKPSASPKGKVKFGD